jgi:hypothetical protein
LCWLASVTCLLQSSAIGCMQVDAVNNKNIKYFILPNVISTKLSMKSKSHFINAMTSCKSSCSCGDSAWSSYCRRTFVFIFIILTIILELSLLIPRWFHNHIIPKWPVPFLY